MWASGLKTNATAPNQRGLRTYCSSTPPSLLENCRLCPQSLPLISAMALANAVAALKIVGPLAAIVPVFGPQLEALINVAKELWGVADVRKVT